MSDRHVQEGERVTLLSKTVGLLSGASIVQPDEETQYRTTARAGGTSS